MSDEFRCCSSFSGWFHLRFMNFIRLWCLFHEFHGDLMFVSLISWGFHICFMNFMGKSWYEKLIWNGMVNQNGFMMILVGFRTCHGIEWEKSSNLGLMSGVLTHGRESLHQMHCAEKWWENDTQHYSIMTAVAPRGLGHCSLWAQVQDFIWFHQQK